MALATLPDSITLEVADAAALPWRDASANLIVTSPPYGLGKDYGTDDDAAGWPARIRAWLTEMYRVAAEHGRLALNVPLDTTRGGFRATYPEAHGAAIAAGWTYRACIVWAEGNVSKSTGRGSVDSPNCVHIIAPVEVIALYHKGAWNLGRRGEPSDLGRADWLAWTNGLWTFPGESRPWEQHPAAFPAELPTRLIKLLSFPGDVVADPFLGSGTTAVAARRLGRRCLGSDVSTAYVESTRRRLDAAGGGSLRASPASA
jgi:site-specific DNA-methyltransferase (adenine-specific)